MRKWRVCRVEWRGSDVEYAASDVLNIVNGSI